MKLIKNLFIFLLIFIFTLLLILYAIPEEKTVIENKEEQEKIVTEAGALESFEHKDLKDDLTSVFMPVKYEESPNQELQEYITGQEKIDINHIELTAEKKDDEYISSRIETVFRFKYGDFSFRIKDMEGKGIFPAIWMLPSDGRKYPEIDIYEHLGNEPYKIYGVAHFMENKEYKREFFDYTVKEKEPYILDFHWSEDQMIWKVNGREIYRLTEHIPDEYMFMIINQAIGGTWPGSPDSSTVFPSTFEIDVLRFEPRKLEYR